MRRNTFGKFALLVQVIMIFIIINKIDSGERLSFIDGISLTLAIIVIVLRIRGEKI